MPFKTPAQIRAAETAKAVGELAEIERRIQAGICRNCDSVAELCDSCGSCEECRTPARCVLIEMFRKVCGCSECQARTARCCRGES